MSARRVDRALRQTGIYDGVVLVDKPSGPTSHDVVSGIRHRFKFDKVGHGGTLDPQATGLLVMLIERGTKLSSHFLNSDKTYEGVMKLGVVTDTLDAQGTIIREGGDYGSVTSEQLEAEASKFKGDIMQTPPMVSAVKKSGVPLYKLARRGKTVERKPRLIHVYNFDLLDVSLPLIRFVMKCTKGTYVRSICADMGENLGCGAHLHELRRLRCGEMDVKDTVSLKQILAMTKEELLERIIPLHSFAGQL